MFLGTLPDDKQCFKVIKILYFPLANKGRINTYLIKKVKYKKCISSKIFQKGVVYRLLRILSLGLVIGISMLI